MLAAPQFQNAVSSLENVTEDWDDELAFAYAAQTLAAYRGWSDQRFGTIEERGPDHFLSCMVKTIENLEHDTNNIDAFADLAFLMDEALRRSEFTVSDLQKAMRERFESYSQRA